MLLDKTETQAVAVVHQKLDILRKNENVLRMFHECSRMQYIRWLKSSTTPKSMAQKSGYGTKARHLLQTGTLHGFWTQPSDCQI